MSAGSLGVGCWEADICRVFLLLHKWNQLKGPIKVAGSPVPRKEESRAKGQQGLARLRGASPRPGFRVKSRVGCTPLPDVQGQVPSVLTTVGEEKTSPGLLGG